MGSRRLADVWGDPLPGNVDPVEQPIDLGPNVIEEGGVHGDYHDLNIVELPPHVHEGGAD